MLRTYITAHFASEHSPEREQRLLFVVSAGNTGEAREGPDDFGAGIDEADDVVETQTKMARSLLLGAAAEAILLPKLESKADLFDVIYNNGALDVEIEAIADHRGLLGTDGLLDETKTLKSDKEQIVEAILQNPANALCAARILEERKQKYENFVRDISQRLKDLRNRFGLEIDAEQLLNIVERMKVRPEEEGFIEAFARELKVPVAGHQEALLGVAHQARDVIKMAVRRKAFAKYAIGDSPEETAISMARDEELATMERQSNIVKQYLDAVLRRESTVGHGPYARWINEATRGKTDEQIYDKFGVTGSGLKEAYVESAEVYADILRRNDDNARRNLPSPSEKDYLDKVERALEEMKRANKLTEPHEWTTPNGQTVTTPRFVYERYLIEKGNEDGVRDIAARLQKKLAALSQKRDNDMITSKLQEIAEVVQGFESGGTPTYENIVAARTLPSEVIKRYRTMLDALDGTPDLSEKMQIVSARQTALAAENSPNNRLKLLARVQQLEAKLPELLTHHVCDSTGARVAVYEKIRSLNLTLSDNAAGLGETLGLHSDAEYGAACVDVEEMEKALTLVRGIYQDPAKVVRVPTKDDFERLYPGEIETKGLYDYAKGTIFINEAAHADASMIDATIEHERGHAVLDILSRQTGVLPNLYGELRLRLTGGLDERVDFPALLRTAAKRWGYTGNEREDELLDELIVQYADYTSGKMMGPLSAEENQLFTIFSERQAEGPARETQPELRIARSNRTQGTSTADDDDEEAEEAELNKPNPRGRLQDLSVKLRKIDAFFDVYKDQRGGTGIEAQLKEMQGYYDDGKIAFNENKPEDKIMEILDKGHYIADGYLKQMRGFDAQKMDLTYAEKTQKSSMYKKVIDGANWLSISDLMTLFQDAGEDVKRMWKRRSESARSTFGKNLFGLIPEQVPYFGQLHREFHGREKSSEQEEVGVWEKRYEKIDSHVLLHDILPKLIRKDAVKGVVNLLCKRGRMDWNYTPFWDVLERLSIYHMPKKACLRDQQLRNQYLQKLIANIWDDKDQFEHWKNENDSAIGSGKSHLQATIDELSATQGGLAGKLKYLLEKLKLQNQHISGIPAKEEEINPHLYEGILHYAMRNGKMAMEDKIFFLIQGVAHRMFSIDRMKAFLGEQGEILNSFPVIDYFNNKTYPEVMEMAKKIGFPEADEPDFRTTDFLLDEIRVDAVARQRVQKGKKAVQNWDHEDLPMFISMLDYKAMNDVIAPTSGSTPKVTDEGMKNIYVGYNTVLQYFAIRAKYSIEKNKPFSDEDARQCATILAAYFNFDNRVSIPAKASERPTLSWTNINNEKPVSGGDYYTYQYRDVMKKFSKRLVDQQGITKAGNVDIDEYIGYDRSSQKPGDYAKCEKDMPSFSESFIRTFSTGAGKQKLVQLLASMADKDPSAGGFIPEGYNAAPHAKTYNYKTVSEYMNESSSNGQAHGGGHGGH